MILKTSTALCIAALCMIGGRAQLVVPDSNTLVAVIRQTTNGINAVFTFTPVTKGTGAQVDIEVTAGLSKGFALSPSKGFEYHVHVNPVRNNDCMTAGGHLDPANVGAVKCVPAKPEKCQEGDLSGKHGELKATDNGVIPKVSYVDHQLLFNGATTTIAGRSVVIHNNGTRVACGNILPYGQATSQSISDDPLTNLADQGVESKNPTSGANGSRYEYGGVNGGHALVALGVVASWMMMM
ncbi:hypothetical protein BGZ82_007319 [Podila clonocystis]|nr:hypothetical protein BGZ82_007319 [Podila clonocystis]